MILKYGLVFLIIPLVLTIIVLFSNPDSSSQLKSPPIAEGYQRYENSNLGFAIDYPENFQLKDYGLEQVKVIGDQLETNIQPLANKNFDDQMDNIKQGISCDADGPNSSVVCPTDRMIVTNFTNDNGASGYKIERVTVDVRYAPERSQKEYWQSIYVFPLTNQDYYAVAIGPISTYNFEEDVSKLTMEVAESFYYLTNTGATPK